MRGRLEADPQFPILQETRPRRAKRPPPPGQSPLEIIPSRGGWRWRFDTVARQQVHEEQRDRSNRISWRGCTVGGSSGPVWCIWCIRSIYPPIHLAHLAAMGCVLRKSSSSFFSTKQKQKQKQKQNRGRGMCQWFRPCQRVWVVDGILPPCFFAPAQLLEGQTPSFQMFDWEGAGGFDDQLQPLPCPALPWPSPRAGCLLGWTVGRLDGWLGGWIEWKGGWVDGWKAQRRVRNGAQPRAPAVSHLIRQNAGWDWKRAWVKTKRPARHML